MHRNVQQHGLQDTGIIVFYSAKNLGNVNDGLMVVRVYPWPCRANGPSNRNRVAKHGRSKWKMNTLRTGENWQTRVGRKRSAVWFWCRYRARMRISGWLRLGCFTLPRSYKESFMLIISHEAFWCFHYCSAAASSLPEVTDWLTSGSRHDLYTFPLFILFLFVYFCGCFREESRSLMV